MQRLLLVALLVWSVGGCKERPRDSKNRPSRADTPVARVEKIRVDGTITATRDDGSSRPLRAGAQLFADDSISTDGDATLEVRIFHNKTRVVISKADKRKLRETAAWQTSKEDNKKRKRVFIDRDNNDETPSSADVPTTKEPGGPAIQPPDRPIKKPPAKPPLKRPVTEKGKAATNKVAPEAPAP